MLTDHKTFTEGMDAYFLKDPAYGYNILLCFVTNSLLFMVIDQRRLGYSQNQFPLDGALQHVWRKSCEMQSSTLILKLLYPRLPHFKPFIDDVACGHFVQLRFAPSDWT